MLSTWPVLLRAMTAGLTVADLFDQLPDHCGEWCVFHSEMDEDTRGWALEHVTGTEMACWTPVVDLDATACKKWRRPVNRQSLTARCGDNVAWAKDPFWRVSAVDPKLCHPPEDDLPGLTLVDLQDHIGTHCGAWCVFHPEAANGVRALVCTSTTSPVSPHSRVHWVTSWAVWLPTCHSPEPVRTSMLIGVCSHDAVMKLPPQTMRGWSLIKADNKTKGCWNHVRDMAEDGCYAHMPKSGDDAAKKLKQKELKAAAAAAAAPTK